MHPIVLVLALVLVLGWFLIVHLNAMAAQHLLQSRFKPLLSQLPVARNERPEPLNP